MCKLVWEWLQILNLNKSNGDFFQLHIYILREDEKYHTYDWSSSTGDHMDFNSSAKPRMVVKRDTAISWVFILIHLQNWLGNWSLSGMVVSYTIAHENNMKKSFIFFHLFQLQVMVVLELIPTGGVHPGHVAHSHDLPPTHPYRQFRLTSLALTWLWWSRIKPETFLLGGNVGLRRNRNCWNIHRENSLWWIEIM